MGEIVLGVKFDEIVSIINGHVIAYHSQVWNPALDERGNETSFSWLQELRAGRLRLSNAHQKRCRLYVDTSLPDPGVCAARGACGPAEYATGIKE